MNGKIISFRPRGKEGSAEPVLLNDEDEVTANMQMSNVRIPSWQQLFDDNAVTYKDVSVIEQRARLDITNQTGREELIDLEDALLAARAEFTETAPNIPFNLRWQAKLRIGETAYELGCKFAAQEMKDLGRDVLIGLLGSEGAKRKIDSINTKTVLRQTS